MSPNEKFNTKNIMKYVFFPNFVSTHCVRGEMIFVICSRFGGGGWYVIYWDAIFEEGEGLYRPPASPLPTHKNNVRICIMFIKCLLLLKRTVTGKEVGLFYTLLLNIVYFLLHTIIGAFAISTDLLQSFMFTRGNPQVA